MRIKRGYQSYEIIGAPTDVQGAEALKEISPHQLEWWALVARPSWPWGRFTGETPVLRARPAEDHKEGADTGIDGYINFFDDKSGQTKQVIAQVNSGHVGANHVRGLTGRRKTAETVILRSHRRRRISAFA